MFQFVIETELKTEVQVSLRRRKYHLLHSRASVSSQETKDWILLSEDSSRHWFRLNLLLTKTNKSQPWCPSPDNHLGSKCRTFYLSLLNATSLDLVRCCRLVEITSGGQGAVWGSWICQPKHLLSLQMLLDHRSENVFCILIRTKLEPRGTALENPW